MNALSFAKWRENFIAKIHNGSHFQKIATAGGNIPLKFEIGHALLDMMKSYLVNKNIV